MSDEFGSKDDDSVTGLNVNRRTVSGVDLSAPRMASSSAPGGREQHHAPREARSVFSEAITPGVEQRTRTAGRPSANRSRPERPSGGRRSTPRARRMNLSLVRLDAWSVAKVTFLLAVAGGIIQIIAVGLIWALLNSVGVFDQITQIFSSTGLDAGSVNLTDIFSLSTILSAVTIFSIVEVIIFTLLSTIMALLYNAVSALVGGIHGTLGDD